MEKCSFTQADIHTCKTFSYCYCANFINIISASIMLFPMTGFEKFKSKSRRVLRFWYDTTTGIMKKQKSYFWFYALFIPINNEPSLSNLKAAHQAGAYPSTVRIKCLDQEHNTMYPARAQTWTTHSEVKSNNHVATTPPLKVPL